MSYSRYISKNEVAVSEVSFIADSGDILMEANPKNSGCSNVESYQTPENIISISE